MSQTTFTAADGSDSERGVMTVDSRYGPLLVPAAEDVIGRFLQRYGEWAWFEASFVAGLLPDHARILDGGAFLGTFGLGVALCRPDVSVCYVEANPASAATLRRNVTALSASPVTVVSAMIGGAGATPRRGQQAPGNLGATSFNSADPLACDAGLSESTTTLLGLRETHGPFDLIKLDLEGMETEALEGDPAFLSSGQATLWLECNEDRRSLHLARLLLDWKLPLYYFAFPSFNPGNFNGDPAPVFPMAYEAALLAAPRREPVLSEALASARCILKPVRSIHDLKLALWRTPRWGIAGWDDATQPELAALATRLLRSEEFDAFLRDDSLPQAADWANTSPAVVAQLRSLLETERAQRAAIDAALREASALAIDRLHELAEEHKRRAALEAGLRAAERLAISRLAAVTEEEKRREAAETQLARTSARTLVHLVALGEARERAEHAEQVAARLPAMVEDIDRLHASEAALAAALTQATQAREHAESEASLAEQRVSFAEQRRHQAEAVAARIPVLEGEADQLRRATAAMALTLEEARQTRQWTADKAQIAEERAAIAETQAAIAHEVVEVITSSTVWRASAPFRSLISKWPALRTLARRTQNRQESAACDSAASFPIAPS